MPVYLSGKVLFQHFRIVLWTWIYTEAHSETVNYILIVLNFLFRHIKTALLQNLALQLIQFKGFPLTADGVLTSSINK